MEPNFHCMIMNFVSVNFQCDYDCIIKMEILPNNLDARPNHEFTTFEKK
jgi:hypothetical protein